MQREIPASIYRGGTSRGVFFRAEDLPPERQDRDGIFVEIMGAGHPLQIDGLGGTYSSNSKVVVVSLSDIDGVDVDYEFAQVGVERPDVNYEGNCGNLTAAVGAFAIDEGLVEAVEPSTKLVLRSLNTDGLVRLEVPVANARSVVHGDTHLPGCNVTGAAIPTTFLDRGGSVFGATLPTGPPIDTVEVDGETIEVSVVDITGPIVFVEAEALGMTAHEVPTEVNANQAILDRVERVRLEAARLLAARDGRLPPGVSAAQPKLAICAAGTGDSSGVLTARVFSMGRMHHAFTQTGLMCAAGALRIPGTIPHQIAGGGGSAVVGVRHPGGVVEVGVVVGEGVVQSITVTRTARLIMRGSVYVRDTREG